MQIGLQTHPPSVLTVGAILCLIIGGLLCGCELGAPRRATHPPLLRSREREIYAELANDQTNKPRSTLELDDGTYELTTEVGSRYPALFRSSSSTKSLWYDFGPLLESIAGSTITALGLCGAEDRLAVGLRHPDDSAGETLSIIQRRSGLSQHIVVGTVDNLVWNRPCSTLYFGEQKSGRTERILSVENVPGSIPRLVMAQPSAGHSLSLRLSESGTWIIITDRSPEGDTIYLIPSDSPKAHPIFLASTERSTKLELHDQIDRFLVLKGVGDSRALFELQLTGENSFKWIPLSTAVKSWDSFRTFKDFVVAHERYGVTQVLQAYSNRLEPFAEGRFEGVGEELRIPRLAPFSRGYFEFEVSSLISKPTRCRFDIVPHRDHSCRRSGPQGGTVITVDSAISADHTVIPITRVSPPAQSTGQAAPYLLVSYGAYGEALSQSYSALFAPLIQRGIGVALAHIRGGNEGGPTWHTAACRSGRELPIADLIAVAEKLGGRVVSYTRSAGALAALGAAIKRPDLFRGMALANPFVDVESALRRRDDAAAREQQEWGDVDNEIDLANIRAFSPAAAALPVTFPPLYVRLAAHDEAVETAATLRWLLGIDKKYGPDALQLRMSETASHRGEAYLYDELSEDARMIDWIISRLE